MRLLHDLSALLWLPPVMQENFDLDGRVIDCELL